MCLSSGYHNKIPYTGWFKHQKLIFSTVLEAGSITSECQAVLFWESSFPGLQMATFLLGCQMAFPWRIYMERKRVIFLWSSSFFFFLILFIYFHFLMIFIFSIIVVYSVLSIFYCTAKWPSHMCVCILFFSHYPPSCSITSD